MKCMRHIYIRNAKEKLALCVGEGGTRQERQRRTEKDVHDKMKQQGNNKLRQLN